MLYVKICEHVIADNKDDSDHDLDLDQIGAIDMTQTKLFYHRLLSFV